MKQKHLIVLKFFFIPSPQNRFSKDIKIMVGGAVLTGEYAKEINADYYAKDGLSAVKCVKEYYK